MFGGMKMAAQRYCLEIKDRPSPYNWFAYFDTADHLAQFLFDYEKVDVTVEEEYGKEEDPYRILLVRIPGEQRQAFLKVIDILPGLMEYVGKLDYDDFCLRVLADADRVTMGKGMGL